MIRPSLPASRRAPHVVLWVLAVLFTLVVGQAWAVAPEPPRVFLDTTLVAPTGTTIAVSSGGDLQAALNAAQPGDVITLQAGATFTGPFTLPNKTGTGWITVRTSAPDTSLPAPGTRVNPSYATVMPKIVVGGDPAIGAAAGAHHFRFIGLEIKPLSGAMNFRLVELGTGGETSTATLPHDIIIDRCYIHGNAGQAAIRGVALNGSRIAVIDSYLAEFKDQGSDTQALMGWNGPGPFKIVNNYLEAAGENVMFGGADPSITNLVPADIEIRGNHFFKPTAWRGVWAAVKNLFELKNARRVLIEGNIFENNWLAAQAGWAVQFTVRNQDGTAPWSTIEDVTFQKNIVRHSGSGLNILAADDPNPSQTMKRVLVRDNLFDDINGTTWGGNGRLFQILGYAGGSTDLVIEHNSGFQQENVNYSEGVPHLGFIYRNNITPRGAAGFGFIGQGAAEGISTLTIYFPLAVFQRNVIAGGNAAIYPADDSFPSSLAAVGFVDLAGHNYRLAASSPYKNAATDGTDIGANIDALEASTASVISGAPGTSDTVPPTVSLTAPANGVTVTGSTVTVSANASDNVGVARVQFRLDGANLGAAVTTPPYSISWNTTTATNASHTLTAQAFDAAGNMGSSAPVTVTVSNDKTPPTVAISSPTAGQTVSGVVTITASAADNVGVTRIDYLQDGQVLAVLSPAVFTFTWNTTTVSNGSHSLSARAYDAAGNATTSAAVTVTVSNVASPPPPPPPAPTRSPYKGVPFSVPGLIEAEDFDNGGEGVSWHDLTSGNQGGFYRTNTDVDIIAPTGNATGAVVNNFQTGEWLEYTISVAQTGTYRLEANASSEFSTSRWHAEIDGVNVTGSVAVPNTGWWGTFQWIGVGGVSLSAGQHVLRIYADQEYFNLDALRVVASGDTTLPTVSITAPTVGATVVGTVTVAASASDNVGVVGVQFKLDGANLGAEVTTAPYSTAWDTSTAANGSHSLTAVARDAAGNTATATAVTVTVSNASIPPGLVAAYSFNQGSGATALDASGNGNNGTISGATWTSQGRYGSALSFDGVTALVRASNVTLGGAFTIMAWVYNPTNTAYETIVTVGTNRDLYLRSGVITFYDGSTERPFGSAISRKRWHHVAVVSDGSTLSVYLDGAPSGTPQAASFGAITGTLQVGAWTLGSVNYDFFGGRIDEVRVYSRALTQAEVQSDMTTPVAP